MNSTLTRLSLVSSSGDYAGLLPRQLAQHPLTAPHVNGAPIAEAGLPLSIGAIRSDAVVSPLIRHFTAHRHRAAHQLSKQK